MKKNIRIHVTGARGFLGGRVVPVLSQIGAVAGTDVDDLDITDETKVFSYFEDHPADVIVHLAALKGNLSSWENPRAFLNVNTLGTLNLLEACRRFNISRFVLMSSLTVHGKVTAVATERSPVSPLHPYGASKAAAEALVQAYVNTHKLRASLLRPNFIVGPIPAPARYHDNIIYDFIRAVEDKNGIELAGTGAYQREWVHVDDVAVAVKQAILKDHPGCEAYILSANRVSMKELARRIVKKVGKGRVSTNPSLAGFTLISSGAKARKYLGWKPTKTIDHIINEIWNEYQQRKNSSDNRHESGHRSTSR